MNNKTKMLLGIVALAAVIGISSLLYRALTQNYGGQSPLRPFTSGQDALTKDGTQGSGEPAPGDSPEAAGVPALDFSMEDTEGNIVSFSDFIGKPIVLNFWASWCPPCKSEMPDFDKVWAELGEDVTFLMLNATDGDRETKEKAQKFLEQQDFSFPVYYDTTQEASYSYGVSSLPTTLFIDKDGMIVTGVMGMIDEKTLREGIEMITQ